MKSKTKVKTISPYNDHSDNYFLVIFYEISLVNLSEEQLRPLIFQRSKNEVMTKWKSISVGFIIEPNKRTSLISI